MGQLRKRARAFLLPILILVGTACTEEQRAAFNMVTGSSIESVEEANAICDGAFGPGSGEADGECVRVATGIVAAHARVNQLESAATTRPAITDCHSAVNYVFAGRWDISRAHMVVQRESGNQPGAVNSSSGFKGCGQLSPTIQSKFLGGPWNDPYWNVLAIKRVVDAKGWGWCHWDIVNFCNAGGEF